MDDNEENILIGIAIGVVVTVLIWITVADQTEISKVRNGYLTLKNKTYTVTLYDTLDAPKKDSKD